MEQQRTDPGTEIILDNRKLILGFILLVALCGACFVIGFMEGKRQAIQAKVDAISPGLPAPPPGESVLGSGTTVAEKSKEIKPAKDRSVKEQLDWYKNVQRAESGAAKAPATTTEVAQPASAAQPQKERPAAVAPAAKPSYTVQVGAFRQMREAETKADALKAKGFECLIEPPKPESQLYLVKVGRFESRAEAVAMQRKLTKAGFSCFIKTN